MESPKKNTQNYSYFFLKKLNLVYTIGVCCPRTPALLLKFAISTSQQPGCSLPSGSVVQNKTSWDRWKNVLHCKGLGPPVDPVNVKNYGGIGGNISGNILKHLETS